jgi:hypothetical protein
LASEPELQKKARSSPSGVRAAGRLVGLGQEAVGVGQAPGLIGHGLGDLVAAVAGVDAPQARHGVQELAALGVANPHALALGQDPGAARLLLDDRGEGVEDV